jgi:hypothetical protein
MPVRKFGRNAAGRSGKLRYDIASLTTPPE